MTFTRPNRSRSAAAPGHRPSASIAPARPLRGRRGPLALRRALARGALPCSSGTASRSGRCACAAARARTRARP